MIVGALLAFQMAQADTAPLQGQVVIPQWLRKAT
jgi:hypothetical protein